MFNFTALPPLSLYVHIPWCVRKCPYCDFNSHQSPQTLPEMAYVDALISDLGQDLPRVWGRQVQSIFIGGGTPSLFSPQALDHLLSNIRAMVQLQPLAEITLEANPGTLEAGRFREYRALGINRLSIGVQSFHDEQLKRLGRIHNAAQARQAAELAHTAGFENFNLDLMFALPGQSPDAALADIEAAIQLSPSHLSHYQLTLEPNTLFHNHPPAGIPEDETMWAMQEACQERLATAGYGHYEVSAYARPNQQCQHNLNYWEFGDYLGIGAGAHGKITHGAQQNITRLTKQRQPARYMAACVEQSGQPSDLRTEQVLSPADAGFEFMLNALRLQDGFAPHLFSTHTGLALTQIEAGLRQAEAKGLLEWSVQRIKPTRQGHLFLNDLLELFCHS